MQFYTDTRETRSSKSLIKKETYKLIFSILQFNVFYTIYKDIKIKRFNFMFFFIQLKYVPLINIHSIYSINHFMIFYLYNFYLYF